MKTLFLLNVTAITPRGLQPNHTIKIQDGRITAVLPNGNVHELPADDGIFDACGADAAPGARWLNGLMPLNKWVACVMPWRVAAKNSS